MAESKVLDIKEEINNIDGQDPGLVEAQDGFEVDGPVKDPEGFEAEEDKSKMEELEEKVNKGLRKLNPKYKTKAERKAELAALSEVETPDYVPQEHPSVYDVTGNKKVYNNNYVLSALLLIFAALVFPYNKMGTALLAFYGVGVAWTVYSEMRISIHVDGTKFTLKGNKFAGEYTFDQVEKIIYTYNKKSQRRYEIYVDGKRICKIAPGSFNNRHLYDDMIAYGVPGGFINRM